MRLKRTASEEAWLLNDKVIHKNTLGVVDKRRIEYFLKNINTHPCFKESLQCVYNSFCNVQRRFITKIEQEICELLIKNAHLLDISPYKRVIFNRLICNFQKIPTLITAKR